MSNSAEASGKCPFFLDDAGRVSRKYSPNDPEQIPDPWPLLRAFREETPIFHSPLHNGFWLVSKYEYVAEALRDPESFTSAVVGTSMPEITYIRDKPFIPVEVDDPEHAEYRMILSPRLSNREVGKLEDDVRAMAREDLAKIAEASKPVDLVQEFALPLVSKVLMLTMGMPLSDAPRVVDTAMDLFRGRLTDPDLHRKASAELAAYVDENIDARLMADDLPNDLFGVLLSGKMGDGRSLTREEVHMYAMNIFVAGFETTVNAIGSSLWYLTQNVALREELKEEPSKIKRAVEEFLRFFTPVQLFGRNATRDFDFHGTHFKKGETIFLHYASANRDEEAFADPERFNAQRWPNKHFAFGMGAHFCMGAHLARLEIRVTLEEVLATYGNYELEGEPEWNPSGDQRGLWRLPVRLA